MNNMIHEIVHTAVRLAKNERLSSVAALRARLNESYPDKEGQVDEAIRYLANKFGQSNESSDFIDPCDAKQGV